MSYLSSSGVGGSAIPWRGYGGTERSGEGKETGNNMQGSHSASEIVQHPEFRTIRLRVGGRWYEPTPPDVSYEGGLLRYIHNIRPDQFKFAHLLNFTHKLGIRRIPHFFWYRANGVQLSDSLKPIEGEDDVRAMWQNMEDHGEKTVDVFMQDTELEWDDEGEMIDYVIPPYIPLMSKEFNAYAHHQSAVRLDELDSEIGKCTIGLMELTGERPYITTNAFAFGVFRDRAAALESGLRSYSQLGLF